MYGQKLEQVKSLKYLVVTLITKNSNNNFYSHIHNGMIGNYLEKQSNKFLN